jgi:hypothetical protein
MWRATARSWRREASPSAELGEVVEMGEFLARGLGGQALAVLPDEGKAKVGEMAVEQGQVGSRFHGGLVF